MQLQALKEMNASLAATNLTLESKMAQVIRQLESSVITNQRLLAECVSLKKRHEESESQLIEIGRGQDRSQRWIKSYEHLIEDYERCIDQLGLENLLNKKGPVKDQNVHGLLSTRLEFLLKQMLGRVSLATIQQHELLKVS
jgi:hypothetical protein